MQKKKQIRLDLPLSQILLRG